jgi:CO dehydrogenase maturation factor
MKIGVSGKGGSGKTTIAGTLARIIAGRGLRVVAVDDDSNPNLALTVGVRAGATTEAAGLPRDLLEERTDSQGNTRLELTIPVGDLIERYGMPAPDGLILLVMGQPSHGGSG